MKASDTGQPIARVEEVAAGTLFTSDGRPVRAVSEYTSGIATADGRPVKAVSTVIDEGLPVEAISLYAAGTLATTDGRPVGAVRAYTADGTVSAFTFTPESLFAASEAGAWYEVSDLSTVWADTAGTTPASVNGTVARLDDKSGNGNHATQATASLCPILRTLAGKYWLEFDAVDDYLLLPNLLAGSATGAAAWAVDRNGGTGYSTLDLAGTSTLNSEEPFGGDGNLYHDFGNTGRPSFGALGSMLDPYVLRFDRGATTMTAYKNGTALPVSPTTAVGWGTAPRMGHRIGGDVYGMILLGRQFTASEATGVEEHLAALNGAVLA